MTWTKFLLKGPSAKKKKKACGPYIDNSNNKNEKSIFLDSLPDMHFHQVIHHTIHILQQNCRGPVATVIFYLHQIIPN